jgi:hypothetical protein
LAQAGQRGPVVGGARGAPPSGGAGQPLWFDELASADRSATWSGVHAAAARATDEAESVRRSKLPPTLGEPEKELRPLFFFKRVNERLWEIEDEIRVHERQQDFGSRFVELARAVYKNNDERARLKKAINALTGSLLIEEKSYAEWGESQPGGTESKP